jgi:hypothetical protein
MKSLGFIPLALIALSGGLVAQGAPVPPYQVPAIREPHHFVKLDNKYARVLDVTVPGYDGTLYHIHENPYFWISIGPATLRGNTLGAAEIINIEKKDAEVSWSPALTHRVGNIVADTFRNITVQIQAKDDISPGTSFTAVPKPRGYQAQVPLDNELVHVERLILGPGESTGKYTLPKSGILIAAHDGTIRMETEGRPAQSMTLKAGDFDWHTGPQTHTITNVGTTRFEAIEVVWK